MRNLGVICCSVGLTALLVPTGAFAITIDTTTPVWTTPSYSYYLNNNFDGDTLLAGVLQSGAYGYATADGSVVGSIAGADNSTEGYYFPNWNNTAQQWQNTGAKSVIRLGDYYYATHGDGWGIARFNTSWEESSFSGDGTTSSTSFVNPTDPNNGHSVGPESITTDGVYIYTNDDVVRDRIHAYSVAEDSTDTGFTLNEEWSVDLPDGGRVRGLTYDSDSGYLYMHNGGAGSSGTGGNTLYAIDTATHTAHKMGTHIEGDYCYQALRYGDEVLVFGYSGDITAYELTNDYTIGAETSTTDLNIDVLWGAAIQDNVLFVANGKTMLTAFNIITEEIPEPGTMLLALLGAVCLLRRPRRRC